MAAQVRKLDGVLAALAGRQHGLVSREQLLAAGFSRHEIQRRVSVGGLIAVHRGVYLVGHTAGSPLADECAAILACRPRALLSHWTAARLWELLEEREDGIHVTVVGRRRRSTNGIRVHYLDELSPQELRRHSGLPITSPSLTVLDLAGICRTNALTRALNEARVQRLVTDRDLREALKFHPKRRGAGALRRLLDGERGPTITRSEAERRALALMRSHGIEPDETDARVGPYRVDFLFRAERLVVEVDGYRFHSTKRRFVDDRRRIATLGALGYQVFPMTWEDIIDAPERTMRRLIEALAMRRELLA